MLGYSIKENQNFEIQLQAYDDERGAGEQVIEENGSFSEHDSYHGRFNYHAKFGNTSIRITSYNVCYTKLLRWGIGAGPGQSALLAAQRTLPASDDSFAKR